MEEKIFEIAVKVHKRTIKKTSQLTQAMRDFVANDAVFSAHFATMRVTKRSLARFYLRELEHVAKGGEDSDRDVAHDERRVTVEHVIPLSEVERVAH